MGSLDAGSRKSPLHVAVLGGSAGSMAPLRSLLERLQLDHVSYIISTHLSPTWDSQLAPLLQKYSILPIHKVTAPIKLLANHVYVGGEGVDLTIENGMLCTEVANRSGPLRSIDRLMFTVAEGFGSRAIGIVLSGAGYDGTAGLAAIRRAGGITMVQAPETAQMPTMPEHAKPHADYCMAPEALGDQLMREFKEPPQLT